jgi:hypothetical protein
MGLSKGQREVIISLGSAAIGVVGAIVVAMIQAHAKTPPPIDSTKVFPHGRWLVQMKTDQWNWAENWINSECRPSDLSGIDLVSIQKGNSSPYSFYVFCRNDNFPSAHYTLSMTPSSDDVVEAMRVVLDNQNAKLGPFYFSSVGHGGAFWYVEKSD